MLFKHGISPTVFHIFFYPSDILSRILCHGLVGPGLVVVVSATIGHVAAAAPSSSPYKHEQPAGVTLFQYTSCGIGTTLPYHEPNAAPNDTGIITIKRATTETIKHTTPRDNVHSEYISSRIATDVSSGKPYKRGVNKAQVCDHSPQPTTT